MNDVFAKNLIKYKTDDYYNDAILEIADIFEISNDESKKIVDDVLDYYHFNKKKYYSSKMSRDQFLIIVHVTQAFRIPYMTGRFDEIISILQKNNKNNLSLLDYGGGGGKDSIIYSKLGYNVTYADILSGLSKFVEKRFKLRDLKNINIVDVEQLGSIRYDIINCMDVIEHVYDVEYVTADIISHLNYNGYLFIQPTFANSWNGDHIEKNCGYLPYYIRILKKIGFEELKNENAGNKSDKSLRNKVIRINRFVFKKISNFFKYVIKIYPADIDIFYLIRKFPALNDNIDLERNELRIKLYKLSRKYSFITSITIIFFLPLIFVFSIFSYLIPIKKIKNIRKKVLMNSFDNIIDNFCIWRLSNHQLNELFKK